MRVTVTKTNTANNCTSTISVSAEWDEGYQDEKSIRDEMTLKIETLLNSISIIAQSEMP